MLILLHRMDEKSKIDAARSIGTIHKSTKNIYLKGMILFGRTKGSLNKKTLERMEFERRVRAEMEKEHQLKAQITAQLKSQDEAENEEGKVYLPPMRVVNSDVNNTRVISKTAPRPVSSAKASKFIPSVRTSRTSISNPNSERFSVKSVQQNISEPIQEEDVKNIEEVNKVQNIEPTESEVTPAPKKRRGRPPKNPKSEVENSEPKSDSEKNPEPEVEPESGEENSKPEDSEKSKRGRSKQPDDEKYDHCSRCHTIIMCSPSRVDTNMASGTSDSHRSCPRYIILCDSCSHELSDIIDKWLFNNGLGVEPKPWSDYGVQKMRQEEKEKKETPEASD